MVPLHEALRCVIERTPLTGKERVKLGEAAGRTLCEDLVSPQTLPPFDQCTREGYAVSSSRCLGATDVSPVRLKIAGEAAAGVPFEGDLRTDRAVRVTTGSMLPPGMDTVVQSEKVQEQDGAISLTKAQRPWQGIRRTGEDVAEGAVVAYTGTVLDVRQLGLLAALGLTRLRVARQPLVHILATGTELVDPNDEPAEGQIRLSSAVTLQGLILQAGATPEFCGIVPDKRKRLRKRIKEHLDCDILITTGGVSTGKYDLVPEVLGDLGAEILVHGVQMRPGSPVLAASHKGTLIFGLPGNPASTVVTFLEIVRPAIWTMLGRKETTPRRIVGIMEHEFSKKDRRRQFVFAHCTHQESRCRVSVHGPQDPGGQFTLASANCLMMIPEHVSALMPGEPVEIEFL